MNSISLRNLTDDELLHHVDAGGTSDLEALVMELAARLSRERTAEEECDARCAMVLDALEDFEPSVEAVKEALQTAISTQLERLAAPISEVLTHVRD